MAQSFFMLAEAGGNLKKFKWAIVFLIFSKTTGGLISVGANDHLPNLPASTGLIALKISDEAIPSEALMGELRDHWANIRVDTQTFTTVYENKPVVSVQTQTLVPASLQPQ